MMIGNRNDHAIELVLELLQHHAVVFIAPSIGVFVKILSRPFVINITDRDVVFTLTTLKRYLSDPATTDKSQIRLQRGGRTRLPNREMRQARSGSHRGSRFEK